MKQTINLSKRTRIILFSLWGLTIAGGIIFFTHNYFEWQKELRSLIGQRISGSIVKLKDLGRGSVALVIQPESDKPIETTSLQIAYEIEQYGIRAGDSLFKEAGSEMMIFYRTDSGGIKKLGEAGIWHFE